MAPRRSKEALELERAAKRISDRAARVERIQTIWYGEILASRPVSCLPVPPLCYSPWSKRGWEYAYRTWRDAVIALGECARLSESWTPTTTSNKTATCVIGVNVETDGAHLLCASGAVDGRGWLQLGGLRPWGRPGGPLPRDGQRSGINRAPNSQDWGVVARLASDCKRRDEAIKNSGRPR